MVATFDVLQRAQSNLTGIVCQQGRGAYNCGKPEKHGISGNLLIRENSGKN